MRGPLLGRRVTSGYNERGTIGWEEGLHRAIVRGPLLGRRVTSGYNERATIGKKGYIGLQ